ncbi:hypothetical protein ACFV1C_12985 [Streptomyces sp. NPDC059605]|uniref:hypothetical protein n=1 Tax=unclassified Streptomyces TaxID=2593676 RepID=UPI00368E0EA5
MGLDITLFMADWERLGAVPAADRADALEDAVCALDHNDDYRGNELSGDWLWPPDRESAWCAEYVFRTTTGTYSPHFRAGNAWNDTRLLVDASVRGAMDRFLTGLILDPDPADGPASTDGAAPDDSPTPGDGAAPAGGRLFRSVAGHGFPSTPLECPPEAVSGKARAWKLVEPRLDELREPFAAECEGWAGRPDTFEDFTALLCEWGDATADAARRGWGLVGLP